MKTETKKRIAALVLSLGLVLAGHNARSDEDAPKIYYKDGLHIDSADEKYTLQLQNRVAMRFTYNALGNGVADNDTFSIPRGEMRIEGNVFSKKLKYAFEMNLATRSAAKTAIVCTDAACTAKAAAVTTESTTGLATLNDFYADWIATDGFGVKVGQFKAPFLMQQLTSSTKQQFVDRSLGTGFFDLGRDIGVSLHGDIFNYHANYSVFFMNGDGPNTENKNQGLLMGARVEVPILGTYKPTESDVEYSETPNFGVGAAYAYNERGSSFENSTIAAGIKASHLTLDAGYKYHGISFQGAGMYSHTNEGTRFTNWGYNTQAGYFIVPKHLEVAAKYSGGIFSDATGAANQYEYSGALNYYVKGHSIKLQTDYAALKNVNVVGRTDHRFRTQLQVIF